MLFWKPARHSSSSVISLSLSLPLTTLTAAMPFRANKKGASKSKAAEVVSREYTVNIHKRIHGVYVSRHACSSECRLHTHPLFFVPGLRIRVPGQSVSLQYRPSPRT